MYALLQRGRGHFSPPNQFLSIRYYVLTKSTTLYLIFTSEQKELPTGDTSDDIIDIPDIKNDFKADRAHFKPDTTSVEDDPSSDAEKSYAEGVAYNKDENGNVISIGNNTECVHNGTAMERRTCASCAINKPAGIQKQYIDCNCASLKQYMT